MGTAQNFPDTRIKDQLNRILASQTFISSRILSRFLNFIVDETLAGKEEEIKEYTIGRNVLSRNSDFNPQLDAVVRIHAGRLRRALKEYYYEIGKSDSIIIEIPKGSYIPIFQSREDQGKPDAGNHSTTTVRNKPVVAVLPFRNISMDNSRDFFADGLGEQLSNELTWFHELSVISYYSSRHVAGLTKDVREAASLLGAKYLLTGSIQNDDTQLRVAVQLINGEKGEQLWSKSYVKSNTASSLFEIQNEIVRNILTALGGYYGAIFREVIKAQHSSGNDGMEMYDAMFWYYHFQKVWTVEVLEKAIKALEAAVEADPDYALAWAVLGELYLDDRVLVFKSKDPIAEGLKCVQRAISIDPNCQHAYQSLAWANLFLHNKEECIKAVEKCIAINPNASDMIGAMGFALTCAGEFEQGYELMNDSIKQIPYVPWWFNTVYVFYNLNKKDYIEACKWADKISRPDVFWDPLLKAATLGLVNEKEKAEQHLRLLNTLINDANNHVENIMNGFLLSTDLIDEIMTGLRKAGMKSEVRRSPKAIGNRR